MHHLLRYQVCQPGPEYKDRVQQINASKYANEIREPAPLGVCQEMSHPSNTDNQYRFSTSISTWVLVGFWLGNTHPTAEQRTHHSSFSTKHSQQSLCIGKRRSSRSTERGCTTSKVECNPICDVHHHGCVRYWLRRHIVDLGESSITDLDRGCCPPDENRSLQHATMT